MTTTISESITMETPAVRNTNTWKRGSPPLFMPPWMQVNHPFPEYIALIRNVGMRKIGQSLFDRGFVILQPVGDEEPWVEPNTIESWRPA